MALDFGDHPDVVYEHAPLLSVLCQVKFPPILSLMTMPGVAGFQSALTGEYPKLVTPPTGPDAPPVWRFQDEDERWTVGLAPDFVSIETPSYTHSGEFLDRFERVLVNLYRTLRPLPSVRIGLRKVNALPAEPGTKDTLALKGMARDELLGPLLVEKFPAPISVAFSFLQFDDDDNRLMVRYGMEATTEPEQLRFILDLDYFTERPYTLETPGPIIDLLRYYSDGITNFFHWAIPEGYRAKLGPKNREAGRE